MDEMGREVKLDLGCGATPREGFDGVDKHHPGARHKVDLFVTPWPWASGSVDELHSSHFLEHVPTVEVDGKDLLVAMMDEAWRVLRPGGTFRIVVPNARSSRAFQDPTHRRFFVAESFFYYSKAWREANGLGHYLGAADFDVKVDPVVPVEMTMLHPEAMARRFAESWNVILDWQATLIRLP